MKSFFMIVVGFLIFTTSATYAQEKNDTNLATITAYDYLSKIQGEWKGSAVTNTHDVDLKYDPSHVRESILKITPQEVEANSKKIILNFEWTYCNFEHNDSGSFKIEIDPSKPNTAILTFAEGYSLYGSVNQDNLNRITFVKHDGGGVSDDIYWHWYFFITDDLRIRYIETDLYKQNDKDSERYDYPFHSEMGRP